MGLRGCGMGIAALLGGTVVAAGQDSGGPLIGYTEFRTDPRKEMRHGDADGIGELSVGA